MEAREKTELRILSEISRISNSAIGLTEKLRRIVEAVARGMGRDGASVFLIDRSGKSVTLAAAVGLNQEPIGKMSFPLGMGIAGWVAEQKVPLALDDPYSDPRFQYVPESGIGKFKSLAAMPILDEDRCLGVIFVLSASDWRATIGGPHAALDDGEPGQRRDQEHPVDPGHPGPPVRARDDLRDRHGAHLHARPGAASVAHRQEQRAVPPRPGLHHPAPEPAGDRLP